MQRTYFNLQKRKTAIERAKNRDHENSAFLHLEAVDILAERLAVTNRKFEKIAVLFEGPFSSKILSRLSNLENLNSETAKQIQLPISLSNDSMNSEHLALEKERFDLIISIFDLHWMNDLPGALSQINNALTPDGLFMAVLPSEGTLQELNQSLIEAETKHLDGATLRVGPFAQVRQLGDLLRRANFKLPVADIEQRLINYSNFDKLMDDLRNTGSTNANADSVVPLSTTVYRDTQKLYLQNHFNEKNKLKATINLAFLSGWREHSSQQKPLKPGSAKENLSDFL